MVGILPEKRHFDHFRATVIILLGKRRTRGRAGWSIEFALEGTHFNKYRRTCYIPTVDYATVDYATVDYATADYGQ